MGKPDLNMKISEYFKEKWQNMKIIFIVYGLNKSFLLFSRNSFSIK